MTEKMIMALQVGVLSFLELGSIHVGLEGGTSPIDR